MRDKLLVICFIAFIGVFAIGSLVVKDRQFSDMENRNLTEAPKFSFESLWKGEFTDQFEKYMSDQIIFKDFLVKTKVSYTKFLGQTKVGDVYFAEDDMIIQKHADPFEKENSQLVQNVNWINMFVDENPDLDITMFLAPNASLIYADKLPDYAPNADEKLTIGYVRDNLNTRVKFVSAEDTLEEHKDEYIYYRTDHHWTANGAYYGYVVLANALGLTPNTKDAYDIETASTDFYGTMYSNAPTFTAKPDEIILYNKKGGEYTVDIPEKNIVLDSVYNRENLNIKDKYTTYLDGNHSFVRIKSNSDNHEKIIVVKDSYSHALLPLLADHYDEIIVVDLRYYKSPVSELAKEEDVSKIVLIYNADFISTDTNFSMLY